MNRLAAIDHEQRRRRCLSAWSQDRTVQDALLTACGNPFGLSDRPSKSDYRLPLDDEAFVAVWREYVTRSHEQPLIDVLRKPFVQWNFPVQEGLSADDAYIGVTRRFRPVTLCPLASGHEFERPDGIELLLQQSAAGCIPVILFSTRADFEYALRSLTRGNEPVEIPRSIGAMMVAGYNNIDRIRRREHTVRRLQGAAAWPAELRKLLTRKALYQDKFILISPGAYSGIKAAELNLSEHRWNRLSMKIRTHHEIAHYMMQRVCGSMNRHLLDEIIADYMGLVQAIGRYRADWFLRFMGIDADGSFVPGGRMAYYVDTIEPDSVVFGILLEMLTSIAEHLEAADARLRADVGNLDAVRMMLVLTTFDVEQLASNDAVDVIAHRYRTTRIHWNNNCDNRQGESHHA